MSIFRDGKPANFCKKCSETLLVAMVSGMGYGNEYEKMVSDLENEEKYEKMMDKCKKAVGEL